MITQVAGMTLDEFIRLYDEEGPFELIDGVRIAMSPNVFGHAALMNWLARILSNFAETSNLGEAFAETTFVLADPDNPHWVKDSRVPDVMFVRAERLAAYKQANPNWKDQPLALVPDWVIEIVSANDRYTEINAKAERYLADGVHLVWIVDPARRAVAVHEPGSKQVTTYTGDQTLTGGAVLPEFKLVVSRVFSD